MAAKKILLNAGTAGRMSPRVAAAWLRGIRAINAAYFGDFATITRYESRVEQVRQSLADWLGADANEIALTHHTTEGINLVLAGFPWKRGDELLTSDLEHSSELIPAWELLRDCGVRVRVLRLLGVAAKQVEKKILAALTARTRMALFSHVVFSTGLRMPIERLGPVLKRKNIFLLVDGAQAFGQVVIDFKKLPVSAYAAAGQKWFCGPPGTGFLYVRKDGLARLRPTRWGWRSVQNDQQYITGHYTVKSSAAKFEEATRDLAAWLAWKPQIKFLSKQQRKIEMQARQQVARAMTLLKKQPGIEIFTPADPRFHAGLLTFRMQGVSSQALWQKMAAAGFIGRTIAHLDAVRVAYHPLLCSKKQWQEWMRWVTTDGVTPIH